MSVAIDPNISLTEIIELVSSDQWSISYSPMLNGPAGTGGTILRSAAPHKGFTKRDGESRQEYFNRLEDSFDYGGEMSSGLQNAIELAENNANNVDGLAVAEIDGTPQLLSRGAVELAKQGDSSTVGSVKSVQSVEEGQTVLQAMGGNNVRPPIY